MYVLVQYVHLSAMSIFNRSSFDHVEVAETKIVAAVVAKALGVTRRGPGGSQSSNHAYEMSNSWSKILIHSILNSLEKNRNRRKSNLLP